MDIACTVRRSFPGPGGIAMMLRSVTAALSKSNHVRVWAARIDGEPLSRVNATLTSQTFPPQWYDQVEVRPIPMGVLERAATSPMALMTVPGLRSLGYQALRRSTAPAYVRTVAGRLAQEWGSVEVVHAWGGEHLNWAAGHAAKAKSLPLVVTPFAHPKAWGDDAMNVDFYKTADAVCALLPTEAAFYASLGIAADRLHVVGVPVTPRPQATTDVREVHGIGKNPIILFLGIKERYKGYNTLLAAMSKIWESSPQARAVFVGPRTEASVADFQGVTDPRIIERGLVDEEEVVAWQRACTVFCLPSTSEIMPVSILEAWNEGKPVVAARWWCADDLIEDGINGLIVEQDAAAVADAVGGLLADPARAKAMGEAGARTVAEKYTPAAVAARHEAAYRAVVAG